jgi:hypothetical protein
MLKQDTRIVDLARAVTLLLAAAGASSAYADGTEAYTGDYPTAVAVADFNGDGMPDAAVINMNSQNLSVVINTTASGSTDLSLAGHQDFSTGGWMPVTVAAADINGDGLPDLIVGDTATSQVSVLINTTIPGDTTVSFAEPQVFTAGEGINAVVTADINGDGKPDVIVNDWNNSAVDVLINETAASSSTVDFDAAQAFAVGSTPYSLVAADLNGDGLPDLATVNFDDNTVSVLINQTANASATADFVGQQVFAAGNMPEGIAAGDLNGDGKADLAVVGNGDDLVSILVNGTAASDTTAVFSSAQTFSGALCSASVAIADVNGDGLPDVVSPGECGSDVAVLVNSTTALSGTIGLSDPQFTSVGDEPGCWSMAGAVADMNADGMPELVIVNTEDGSVGVQLNATSPGDTSLSFLP